MKVFFLASIAVSEEQKDCYGKIVKLIESEGHRVFAQQSMEHTESIEGMTLAENEERAKDLLKKMLQCDCVIFEGTKPSTGCGYYLCSALQRSLPVLFLAQREYKGLYLASSNRLLKFKQYCGDDTGNLKKDIQDFLIFTSKKRLNNRFNLMISDSMEDFLNKVSNDYGTSKADFIRDLIYRKMEED